MKSWRSKSEIIRWVMLGTSFLGIAHFTFALIAWFLFFRRFLMKADLPMLLHAIPAVILFCGFVVVWHKATKRKQRAALILGITLFASLLCFWFDIGNHFYQTQHSGKEFYINWWWCKWPFKQDKWENYKSGYINKKGQIAIEPKFDSARCFSGNIAVVKIGKKFGYIDKSGDYVVEPKFSYARNISEGLAAVEIKDKWGYIDKTGKYKIEPQFDGANDFHDGLAVISVNRKHGYIDKIGQFVIEPQFDHAHPFSEGLAMVTFKDQDNEEESTVRIRRKKDRKAGYIDKTGKIVIPPQFDFANDFSEGRAVVNVNGKYGYIDKTGKYVTEAKFDSNFAFSEGLVAVKFEDKWGYINKAGQFAIEPRFDGANTFLEGLAAVRINNKWGYIDKTGQVVIEPQYERVSRFHNGHAWVFNNNGKWGYRRIYQSDLIDKSGVPTIKANFEVINLFREGLARAIIIDRTGYIDKQGKVVIEPQFIDSGMFCEGLAEVMIRVVK